MKITELRKIYLTFIIVVTVMVLTGGIPLPTIKPYLRETLEALTLLLILITLFIGRVFCGWGCPYGALVSLLNRIKPVRFVISRWFKYETMALSIAVGVILYNRGFLSVEKIQGVRLSFNPSILGYFLLLFFLLITIEFGRLWCTDFCPIGGFLCLLSRFNLFRLKAGVNCVGCKKCDSVCEANVKISENRYVEECNLCWECVEVCPYNDIKMSFTLSS
jgi:ferredoxin-type protein NapH